MDYSRTPNVLLRRPWGSLTLTVTLFTATLFMTTLVVLLSPPLTKSAMACTCRHPTEKNANEEQETAKRWSKALDESDGVFIGTVTHSKPVENNRRVIYTVDVSTDAKNNLDDSIHVLVNLGGCAVGWNVGDTAVATIQAHEDGTLTASLPNLCGGNLTKTIVTEFDHGSEGKVLQLGSGRPPPSNQFLRFSVFLIVSFALVSVGVAAFVRQHRSARKP